MNRCARSLSEVLEASEWLFIKERLGASWASQAKNFSLQDIEILSSFVVKPYGFYFINLIMYFCYREYFCLRVTGKMLCKRRVVAWKLSLSRWYDHYYGHAKSTLLALCLQQYTYHLNTDGPRTCSSPCFPSMLEDTWDPFSFPWTTTWFKTKAKPHQLFIIVISLSCQNMCFLKRLYYHCLKWMV